MKKKNITFENFWGKTKLGITQNKIMCINIYTLIKSTCCKSFMTTSLLFFNAFQICGKIPWFFCWLPFAWLTERLITIDRLTTRWPWINFYKSQNLTTTNKKNTDIKNNNLSLIKCSFYYKSSRGQNSAYCIMWYQGRKLDDKFYFVVGYFHGHKTERWTVVTYFFYVQTCCLK